MKMDALLRPRQVGEDLALDLLSEPLVDLGDLARLVPHADESVWLE